MNDMPGARRRLIASSCLYTSLRSSAVGRVFGWDERWMQFLFSHKNPELRSSPEELRQEARAFSHGEQVMVQVALDIWCGEGRTNLLDVVDTLDEHAFLSVITALLYFRELTPEDLSAAWDELSLEKQGSRNP